MEKGWRRGGETDRGVLVGAEIKKLAERDRDWGEDRLICWRGSDGKRFKERK